MPAREKEAIQKRLAEHAQSVFEEAFSRIGLQECSSAQETNADSGIQGSIRIASKAASIETIVSCLNVATGGIIYVERFSHIYI